jgi:hypothetical protein
MDFQFKKQQENNKRKYPYLLIFELRMYPMKCLNCRR